MTISSTQYNLRAIYSATQKGYFIMIEGLFTLLNKLHDYET